MPGAGFKILESYAEATFDPSQFVAGMLATERAMKSQIKATEEVARKNREVFDNFGKNFSESDRVIQPMRAVASATDDITDKNRKAVASSGSMGIAFRKLVGSMDELSKSQKGVVGSLGLLVSSISLSGLSMASLPLLIAGLVGSGLTMFFQQSAAAATKAAEANKQYEDSLKAIREADKNLTLAQGARAAADTPAARIGRDSEVIAALEARVKARQGRLAAAGGPRDAKGGRTVDGQFVPGSILDLPESELDPRIATNTAVREARRQDRQAAQEAEKLAEAESQLTKARKDATATIESDIAAASAATESNPTLEEFKALREALSAAHSADPDNSNLAARIQGITKVIDQIESEIKASTPASDITDSLKEFFAFESKFGDLTDDQADAIDDSLTSFFDAITKSVEKGTREVDEAAALLGKVGKAREAVQIIQEGAKLVREATEVGKSPSEIADIRRTTADRLAALNTDFMQEVRELGMNDKERAKSQLERRKQDMLETADGLNLGPKVAATIEAGFAQEMLKIGGKLSRIGLMDAQSFVESQLSPEAKAAINTEKNTAQLVTSNQKIADRLAQLNMGLV